MTERWPGADTYDNWADKAESGASHSESDHGQLLADLRKVVAGLPETPDNTWAKGVVTEATSKVDEINGRIEALGGLTPGEQKVERRSRYDGPSDFLSLRPYDDENYANNFWRLLGPVKPLAELIELQGDPEALRQSLSGGLLGPADYKVWPVQYRVDAALPELMQPLRRLVEPVASRGPVAIHEYLVELNLDDKMVAKAVYAAYLLYLQLVEPADDQRVAAWLWGEGDLMVQTEPVVDAHQYLTR